MVIALRQITIIATALFASDVFVNTALGQESALPTATVILEAMPNIPNRGMQATKRKYRSPFIVPISAPEFGQVWPLEEKSIAIPRVKRSNWALSHGFDHLEVLTGEHESLFAGPEEAFNSIKPNNLEPIRAASLTPPTGRRYQSVPVAAVGPNLKKLAERVTLFNLALDAIEDQLRTRDSWNLKELELLLEQLNALHESKQVWMLYWELLEPQQQWHVGSPASYSRTTGLFQQRIFETQVAFDINPFAVTALDETEAMLKFEALSKKLEAIASPRD